MGLEPVFASQRICWIINGAGKRTIEPAPPLVTTISMSMSSQTCAEPVMLRMICPPLAKRFVGAVEVVRKMISCEVEWTFSA